MSGSNICERPTTAPSRTTGRRRQTSFQKPPAGLAGFLIPHFGEAAHGLGRHFRSDLVVMEQIGNDLNGRSAIFKHEPPQFQGQGMSKPSSKRSFFAAANSPSTSLTKRACNAASGLNGKNGPYRSRICQKRPSSIGYWPLGAINLSTETRRPSEKSAGRIAASSGGGGGGFFFCGLWSHLNTSNRPKALSTATRASTIASSPAKTAGTLRRVLPLHSTPRLLFWPSNLSRFRLGR